MPLLREPSWHRHVHRGANDRDVKPEKPDARAEKIRARKARKKEKRLARALDGDFTRTRIAA